MEAGDRPARTGLGAREAAARLRADGPNQLPGGGRRPFARIAAHVLLEPMFLLLLAAAGAYLLLGDLAEAGFLLVSVLAVIGLALVQERRSQRALEALRDLAAPRALVVRDGTRARIPAADVVRGDLLVLGEGDRVPADARLLEGVVGADESLLTGEPGAVTHRPAPPPGTAAPAGAAADDLLYAGTLVTSGQGLALVTATGERTAFGRLGQALATAQEPPTDLQRASRGVVRLLAAGACGAALLLGWLAWAVGGRDAVESTLMGLALALALIPEEIPMVLVVFLAIGAWRLSRQQVLVRRVQAVEAIGGVTVLAVDKTGTLTLNRMQLAVVQAGAQAWRPGEPLAAGPVHDLLRIARLASPAEPFDPMELAIRTVADAQAPLAPPGALLREYPMAADLFAMTRAYADGGHAHLLAAKGAPEAIVQLCRLDGEGAQQALDAARRLASGGLRVLGVARGRWPADGGAAWPQRQQDFAFEFLGLLGFVDPLRPDVPAAVAACRDAGIRVLPMTGDHPQTARAIAAEAGLPAGSVLLGADLARLDDAALRRHLRSVHVCARLRPQHKLRLVRALQADGERVAMTGDGVNDAPALAQADIGVAMGARGSDVAREAADLVLLDDSFASLVSAVRQARRVRLNLHRAMRFIFAVHVPIVALALVPVLLGWPVLLLPTHVVLLELVIDPICSLLFEAEPAPEDVMRRPAADLWSSPFRPSTIGPGLLQGAGVAVLLLGCAAALAGAGWTAPELRTAILPAALAGAVLLASAQREHGQAAAERNPWPLRIQLAVGALLLGMLGLPWLRSVLGLVPPTAMTVLATAAAVVAAWGWLAVATRAGLIGRKGARPCQA